MKNVKVRYDKILIDCFMRIQFWKKKKKEKKWHIYDITWTTAHLVEVFATAFTIATEIDMGEEAPE